MLIVFALGEGRDNCQWNINALKSVVASLTLFKNGISQLVKSTTDYDPCYIANLWYTYLRDIENLHKCDDCTAPSKTDAGWDTSKSCSKNIEYNTNSSNTILTMTNKYTGLPSDPIDLKERYDACYYMNIFCKSYGYKGNGKFSYSNGKWTIPSDLKLNIIYLQ